VPLLPLPTAPRRLRLVALSRALSLVLLLVGAIAAQATQTTSPARRAKTRHAVWKADCSACHMAYPAVLLPRASWRRIMASLANHFGQNATMDAPSRRAISAYLQAHAADAGNRSAAPRAGLKATGAPLRITRSAWFIAAHNLGATKGEENGPRESLGDCTACHRGAARGVFASDG